MLLVLLLTVVAVGLWLPDRFFQKRHAIRRNYPLIGRFRYFFETLGEFFRQYFFAMDRESCRLTGHNVPGFTAPPRI